MEGHPSTSQEITEEFFDNSYELIGFDDSLELNNCRHIAHCCLYSFPNVHPVEDTSLHKSKAYISMQMRFDGRLGFPGGIIDRNEGTDIVRGLNRELTEEMNLDEKYFISRNNHCISATNKDKSRCFHFFTKEVSLDSFREMERNALNAEHYGVEVLGLIRVPLFTLDDGKRGFRTFLSNHFAGCAKAQLLHFVLHSKLMSYDDIKKCLGV